jgi:hypothetical protein
MTFNKEEYWNNKKNNIGSVRNAIKRNTPLKPLSDDYKKLDNGMIVQKSTIKAGNLYINGRQVV